MGVEEMATGKIEPIDLCSKCLWGDFVYRPEKGSEVPIAIDMKPSEACKEYHRKSLVQINIPESMIKKEA